MRRLALAALPACLLAACGGDSGGPATQPSGTASPASSPAFATPTPAATAASAAPTGAARTGSATAVHQGTTYTWAERGCESTRGMDGRVVGWTATFQDAAEQAKRYQIGITDSRSYLLVRLRGGYTGAGAYASENVSIRLGGPSGQVLLATGFGVIGQSLVLRDGGRAGTYQHEDLTVEFSCDPADDTSTTPGTAVADPPAPGTAYVVRPEGAVVRFGDVRCGRAGGETQILADRFPHFFRVLTGVSGGSSGGGRVLLSIHGVVIPTNQPNVRVDLTGTPVTGGTFRFGPSGPNASSGVSRGAFTC